MPGAQLHIAPSRRTHRTRAGLRRGQQRRGLQRQSTRSQKMTCQQASVMRRCERPLLPRAVAPSRTLHPPPSVMRSAMVSIRWERRAPSWIVCRSKPLLELHYRHQASTHVPRLADVTSTLSRAITLQTRRGGLQDPRQTRPGVSWKPRPRRRLPLAMARPDCQLGLPGGAKQKLRARRTVHTRTAGTAGSIPASNRVRVHSPAQLRR